MMRNINHLKFVIGAFFTVAGLFLLSKSFSDDYEWKLNKTIGWGYSDYSLIKRGVGVILILVGIIMTIVSFKKRKANKLPPNI
jgi:uncharacterized membrane protein HdeD (DUF308 family)